MTTRSVENYETNQIALEIANIGVWTWTTASGRHETNSVLPRLLGIEDSGVSEMQHVIAQCIHTDDRDKFQEALNAALSPSGSGGFNFDIRLMRQDAARWLAVDGRAVFHGEGSEKKLEKVITVFRDITKQHEANAHHVLMIDGLNHRVKNILSVVQSVAYQTARRDIDATALFADFQGRLRALGKAHDLLVERRFSGASLEALSERILGSCDAPSHQVTIIGSPLILGAQQTVTMSMVLHELCLNALKFGAFAIPSGHVHLSWNHDETSGLVTILWVETDGPPVFEPKDFGFWSSMVQRAVAAEFGGQLNMDYARDGVKCTMVIPFKSLDRNLDE